MTNAEMLAKVRSLLDETSEDYYLDDEEIYPALLSAELELVKTIADVWFYQLKPTLAPVPKAIQPLVFSDNGTLTTGLYDFSPTHSLMVPISMRWNPNGAVVADLKPAIFLSDGEVYHLLANKELKDGIYCWWVSGKVFLNPPSASVAGTYFFDYIRKPAGISASLQPTTDSVAHDAIVERAMWILLKDREVAVAQTHLQLYGQLLQGLTK